MLVRSTASRLSVAFACPVAKSSGVSLGMTLAEARAMCPTLTAIDHKPLEDAASLRRASEWMIRFSPVVAVESPDALFLDVTGSEKLFKGFARLSEMVLAEVTRLGFSCGIAIAPTPGAAWALAFFGNPKSIVTDEAKVEESLGPLPIVALRLGDEITAALLSLGVETVCQLLKLPRRLLPVRFGKIVLNRIDQALGLIAEPLTAVRPRQTIRAMLEFEAAVESLEMLWEVFKRLIALINLELRERGRGAKRLAIEFVPAEGPPVTKVIHLSSPSVNSFMLFNLLRCAAESVKTNEGFIAISLTVTASEALTDEQLTFFDQENAEADKEFGYLLERLRLRLGGNAVLVTGLAASYLPERAYSLTDTCEIDLAHLKEIPIGRRLKSRPLYLLPEPTEIRCIVTPSAADEGLPAALMHNGESFKLVQVSGPERISGIWWEGRNKTREYFDVEENSGRRFWIFRVAETRRWYLHGSFDC